MHKIDIQTGQTVETFSWNLGSDNEDIHSFTGMGCTPMITGDRVYFGAFNGKLYCLDKDTLKPEWITDLRNEDLAHNQPFTNANGVPPAPPAVIWTSPVVSADGTKLYVACAGEGENPQLYSYVFCSIQHRQRQLDLLHQHCFAVPKTTSLMCCPRVKAVQALPPPEVSDVFDGGADCDGCSVWGRSLTRKS